MVAMFGLTAAIWLLMVLSRNGAVTRAVHAIIYIGFNHVPCRFATYAVSCITLGTMWARFALSLWHPLALTAF
jgi:hypothetical protein